MQYSVAPHVVGVRIVPVASHTNAVRSSVHPSSPAVQTTARHAAIVPSATQIEPDAHASLISIVPSALHVSTAVLPPLHICVPASHTMSSIGTHTKPSQRKPPRQSAVASHSRVAHAPVSVTQYSSAAHAASVRQKNSHA